MKKGIKSLRRCLSALLAFCMVAGLFVALPASAAETTIWQFVDEIQQVGTPWDTGAQLQSWTGESNRLNVNLGAVAADGESGRSEYSIAEDRTAFSITEYHYRQYGDSIFFQSLLGNGETVDVEEPINITLRLKYELEDYTQGDVFGKIRMRLTTADGDTDLESDFMPITEENAGRYQTYTFTYDPATNVYRYLLNGIVEKSVTIERPITTLTGMNFFVMGGPTETPVNGDALPSPLTWTFDNISITTGEPMLPPTIAEEDVQLQIQDSIDIAVQQDDTYQVSSGDDFVIFRNWSQGGSMTPAAEQSQAVWRSSNVSTWEDNINLPGNATGSLTTEGSWNLDDEQPLVAEFKFRVAPDELGTGVKASLRVVPQDSAGVAFSEAVTDPFVMETAADANVVHTVQYVIDKAEKAAYLYADGVLADQVNLSAADLTSGIRRWNIYLVAENAAAGASRTPLSTPITWTFDSIRVGLASEEAAPAPSTEPSTPPGEEVVLPTEKPIPESLKDVVTRTYPGGLMKAAVMSYDDAAPWMWEEDNFEAEKKFLEVVNAHNIKVTFNAVTGLVSDPNWYVENYLQNAEGEPTGHEIASHSVHHAEWDEVAQQSDISAYLKAEAEDSKAFIEQAVGEGNCRGYVTPYGYSMEDYEDILYDAGYVYYRGPNYTASNDRFAVPDTFYNWPVTMWFGGSDEQYALLQENMQAFDTLEPTSEFKLFFMWGHSHDFGKGLADYTDPDDSDNDDYKTAESQAEALTRLDEWCAYLEERTDEIWNPTCLEYVDYVNAVRQLEITDEGNNNVKVVNPSESITCTVKIGDELYEIEPQGEITVRVPIPTNFEYEPDEDSYLYYLDDAIESNNSYTPFVQVGTLNSFSNFRSNDPESITLSVENCSVYTQTFQLNQPAIPYDPEKVTVLKVRYRVGLDDYSVDHPNARLALSNGSISVGGTDNFSPNTNYTPNTGDLTFAEDLEDTWRTVEFVIDPAAKTIYVSNDDGERQAYPFQTELTAENMQNFRLYASVRTADMAYYEGEQTGEIIPLGTSVNWTFDSIEMYQMDPEDFLKVTNIVADSYESTITYGATFRNYGTSAVDPVTGIVALYDGNRLVGIQQVDLSTVEANRTVTVSDAYTVTGTGNYTVKAFIWDSMGNLVPYDMQTVPVAAN